MPDLALPLEGIEPTTGTPQEPKFDYHGFRKRLVIARLRRGWKTREEAAERIGVDARSLRAYEKGRWVPHLPTLFLICERLNVSADWLIWGEKR